MTHSSISQSDAEQAYTQAKLGGTPTWVRLPKSAWPKAWHSMNLKDPVCPLVLALYGHPDAGGFWEKHAEAALATEGFLPIPNRRSCFWHPDMEAFLCVYVDDFKLACPVKHRDIIWAKIRKHVDLDEPGAVGKFLGCNHVLLDGPAANAALFASKEIDGGQFLTENKNIETSRLL